MDEVSPVVQETIQEACSLILGAKNPDATAAELIMTGKFAFLQPGQPYHNQYRWRLGEMRAAQRNAKPAPRQPTPEELVAIESAVAKITDPAANPALVEAQLVQSGAYPFLVQGHYLYDYYMWCLSRARAPPPPRKAGHVTVSLEPNHDNNKEISLGQLMLMLAPLVEDKVKDPGMFVDPNGHIVIPAAVFDEKEQDTVEDF
eukprot:TRINITY_DN6170_c1_g1_i1.p1 TRINITY_DN6170_c1_g1~~TRINITY_DN6170_c1_g1_i1.p1  ORF type:complete len:220 (+),score=87.06 TRINITY_DN6170_c1_g1_i1:56-661(+)